MNISLMHNHYDQQHLTEVKAEMEKRGAPVIRAIWNETYSMWMAVEGCHRLRAAQELGLTPIIKDITGQKTVKIELDGSGETVKVVDLAEELADGCTRHAYITFGE